MNERIRELVKQAGDYVNSVYTPPVRSKTPGKIWEDGHVGWHDQFHEKFAELIVQECIGCCEQVISDPVPKSVDTWLNGGSQCIDEIKEHFGVEE